MNKVFPLFLTLILLVACGPSEVVTKAPAKPTQKPPPTLVPTNTPLTAAGLACLLHEQGYSALDIAQELVAAGFSPSQEELLSILRDEGFSANDLYLVLKSSNAEKIPAETLIHILYGLGYPAVDISRVLLDNYESIADEMMYMFRQEGFTARDFYLIIDSWDKAPTPPLDIALALRREGFSTPEIADALSEEMGGTLSEIFQILRDAGFPPGEIARYLIENPEYTQEQVLVMLAEQGFTPHELYYVLVNSYFLSIIDAERTLQRLGYSQEEQLAILQEQGLPASEAFNVLEQLYSHTVVDDERLLHGMGYLPEDYLEVTAYPSVSRFAPVLKFDGSAMGLPMSAQVYFDTVLTPFVSGNAITFTTVRDGPCGKAGVNCLWGRDECTCGMQNNDFSSLLAGNVPTYYKVGSDIDAGNEGRLRIAYWWFYGFQPACSHVEGCPGADGSHHGDWEHIVVTTSPDRERIDYVTYFFHGDWYTRSAGNYPTYPEGGERPVVFVGKRAHGSYHDQEHSGWMEGTPHACCTYADFRNPNENTVWANVQDNLVSLRSNQESWMLADKIGGGYVYNGVEYSVVSWYWGPHISYCNGYAILLIPISGTCAKWIHEDAISTRPSVNSFDGNTTVEWGLHSCKGTGCGEKYCKGLIYDYDGVYFNMGWPWDN